MAERKTIKLLDLRGAKEPKKRFRGKAVAKPASKVAVKVETVPAKEEKAKAKPKPKKVDKPLTPEEYTLVQALAQAELPAVFATPVPLELKTGKGLVAQVADKGGISRRTVRRFMLTWVGQKTYLETLSKASHRVNLDGSEGSRVTDAHRADAIKRLKKL